MLYFYCLGYGKTTEYENIVNNYATYMYSIHNFRFRMYINKSSVRTTNRCLNGFHSVIVDRWLLWVQSRWRARRCAAPRRSSVSRTVQSSADLRSLSTIWLHEQLPAAHALRLTGIQLRTDLRVCSLECPLSTQALWLDTDLPSLSMPNYKHTSFPSSQLLCIWTPKCTPTMHCAPRSEPSV